MSNNFYAMLSRMKYINRWGLMNNTRQENIAEHSLEVAVLSHALVTVSNTRLGTEFDADKAAVMAIFHDASEIITGDMPTPVKYYNEEIKNSYKQIENISERKMLSMLPEDLLPVYEPLIDSQKADKELEIFVKAADKLSALIKCLSELSMGNREFTKAERTIRQALEKMELPALKIFMEEFLPSYSLTLDEMS